MNEPNTWHAPYQYEKAPGTEYGSIRKVGERLVCHLCGRDFVGLGAHVWWTHGMTADDYRTEFKIDPKQKLAADSVIEKVRHATKTNGGAERLRLAEDPRIAASRFKKGEPSEYQRMGSFARHPNKGGAQGGNGLFGTAHMIVDRWERGLPIDVEIERLGRLIQERLARNRKDT